MSKFKSLKIVDKAKMLEDMKQSPDTSYRKIAAAYNVSVATVCRTVKRKLEITELVVNNIDSKRKRKMKLNKNDDVNSIMNQWWNAVRIKNIPITGPMIQKQAIRYAQKLDLNEFKASDGWLRCFKARNAISFKTTHGEAKDVNNDVVESWKVNLPIVCEGYDKKDIFNADETGLFYRALPNKTLASKNDKCIGGELSKERLTVLLCASSMGEKLKPLVIGKSRQPRCFRRMSHAQLPVTWKWSLKSWMTSLIFEEWVGELNTRMMFE
jgi:hypothetical protein